MLPEEEQAAGLAPWSGEDSASLARSANRDGLSPLEKMPQSRPMSSIGLRCHELRINDADTTWRLIYRIDQDAIVIAEVFAKKTEKTPQGCDRGV
jgi:hypothetical protein